VDLDDPKFTERVDAIAEAAATRVVNAFRSLMESKAEKKPSTDNADSTDKKKSA